MIAHKTIFKYRPGQLNWDFWLCVFHSLENKQFSCHSEFNVKSVSQVKNCCFSNFVLFEFWFLDKFHTWKCYDCKKSKIQSCSNGQNSTFWGFKITKIDFTLNQSDRKIAYSPYTQSKIKVKLPRSVFENWFVSYQYHVKS